MTSKREYTTSAVKAASAAIAKGHQRPAALRELLIWTTSTATCNMVMEYFRKHLDDQELLEALFAIAEEGEDQGDAPWAAANTIVEFPAAMLTPHTARLVSLSNHPWSYLSVLAARAMAKIHASSI